MEEFGCRGVTSRIFERKFKNLKRTYVSIKTRRKQTGIEGGSPWPYYTLFEELFDEDRAINPENIFEVGSGLNRVRTREVSLLFESAF